MYRVVTCLAEQHAVWVVPIAAAVCWVSIHTGLRLIQQVRERRGWQASAWMAAASFSVGAGIWSTHFIGVLGYDPGIVFDFDPAGTLLSLGIAIVIVLAALGLLRRAKRIAHAIGPGLVLGLGVALMHVVGMASVRLPGTLAWNGFGVLTSVACGCVLAGLACLACLHPRTRDSRALVATALTLAVATLHFGAMSAVEVVPALTDHDPGPSLPRHLLTAGIVVVMLAILGFAILALFADRMHGANQALRISEAAHRLSEERLALAVDTDGLWDLALPGGAMWLSEGWHRMLGYTPGDLAGHRRTWDDLIHPADRADTLRLLDEHLAGHGAVFEWEHRLRRADGDWCWVLARGKVVTRDAAGGPTRMVGMLFDTTSRREAERRLAHLALHDALTGLPNRVRFRERLDALRHQARRQGIGFAVLACDLDHFKIVNDTHGHAAGDALLRVVADRLLGIVRVSDTVARIGGDEFAILIGGLEDLRMARAVARRLIAAVAEPVHLGAYTAAVGLSIGIAVGDGELDADALIENADRALYQAKAAGKSTFSVHKSGIDILGQRPPRGRPVQAKASQGSRGRLESSLNARQGEPLRMR